MFAEAKKLQVPDLWDNTALEKYSTLLEVFFFNSIKAHRWDVSLLLQSKNTQMINKRSRIRGIILPVT